MRGRSLAVCCSLSLVITGCAPRGLPESEARRLVEEMRGAPLLKPFPGTRVISTTEAPCGGGSVAPYVEIETTGAVDALRVRKYYERQLMTMGWSDIRTGDDGSLGGTKDERSFTLTRSGVESWRVFLQHGTEVADCE